jgi:hypothetical protein
MAAKSNASDGKASAPAASTKPLWQKMFIKGGTVALIGAPAGYEKLFAGSPAKVTTRGSGLADTVVLFVNDVAELDSKFPTATGRLGPAANLWVAYQKGGKELHRDTARKVVNEYGYEGVAMVALDDVWSALRLKKT